MLYHSRTNFYKYTFPRDNSEVARPYPRLKTFFSTPYDGTLSPHTIPLAFG